MADLKIENLVKTFGRRPPVVAVNSVSLTVDTGEILVLLGPSGCGKTTILRCVAGLEQADSGRIEIGGKPVFDADRGIAVRANRRDIGMVFQNFALWPHMTVAKNVAYPLRARHKKAELRSGRVDEVLRAVHCQELSGRLPSQLSGGQQQRVALARGLVSKPAVMLFDEPLSNLDALLRTALRAELVEIHRELGFTGIFVTHDQKEALQIADRIAVMEAGQVVQSGTPKSVYQSPATPYVAEFLGISNHVTIKWDGLAWMTEAGPLVGPPDDLPGQLTSTWEVFVRPEDIELLDVSTAPNDPSRWQVLADGHVLSAMFSGDQTEYAVEVGTSRFLATAPAKAAPLKPGDVVSVGFRAEDALLYRDGSLVTEESLAAERSTAETGAR